VCRVAAHANFAMGYEKRIVCLANSYKAPLGRCIAGREISAAGAPGAWIRPVSPRPKGELSSWEYSYDDGGRPKVLDIIDVPLVREARENPQTENHIVAPTGRWKKAGELAWQSLKDFVDPAESIWINSGNTREGHNDCMSADEAATLESSLLLIKCDEFTVEALTGRYREGRIYRGRFFYREKYYNFSLTDPAIRERFDSRQEGDYPLDDVYLCLSLTRAFELDKRCHKLIAAVICKPEMAKLVVARPVNDPPLL
jgi:hypothetical protein